MKQNTLFAFLALALFAISGCVQQDGNIFEFGKQFTITEGNYYLESNNKLWINVDSFYDSRCMDGVQCVWEGEQKVRLLLNSVCPKDAMCELNPAAEIYLGEKLSSEVFVEKFNINIKLVSINAAEKTAKIIVYESSDSGILKPSDLTANQDQFLNQKIKVKGIMSGARCTLMACQSENQCCNVCSSEFFDSAEYFEKDFNGKNNYSIQVAGKDCDFDSIKINEEIILEGIWTKETSQTGAIGAEPTDHYYLDIKKERSNPVFGEKEWFSIEPVQCDGNPWEQWASTDSEYNRIRYNTINAESTIIKAWFEKVNGIKVYDFASKQIYEGVCKACSCARGDKVAVLVDSTDSEKMNKLGWQSMENIACTEEAKLCANGTVVGREAPFCEFPDCLYGDIPTEDSQPIIVKTDVPGFVPVEFYEVKEIKIYDDGRITIEITKGFGDDGTVSLEEKRISTQELENIKEFIIGTNFFGLSEEDTRICVADAPTKTLRISIGTNSNEIMEIGAQCDMDLMSDTLKIIEKIDAIVS